GSSPNHPLPSAITRSVSTRKKTDDRFTWAVTIGSICPDMYSRRLSPPEVGSKTARSLGTGGGGAVVVRVAVWLAGGALVIDGDSPFGTGVVADASGGVFAVAVSVS